MQQFHFYQQDHFDGNDHKSLHRHLRKWSVVSAQFTQSETIRCAFIRCERVKMFRYKRQNHCDRLQSIKRKVVR